MQLFVNEFFEERVQDLFRLAGIVEEAFRTAGLEYRVAGGLAAYLYVEEVDPDAGRLTKDIDIVVRREDLDRIREAVKRFGLEYRQVAGVDMLVQSGAPSARRAVHMIFTGEKVRPDYLEPTPEFGKGRTIRQVRLVPVENLIRMKLISFRLNDQTHLKDLEEAGLITPEIEASLSEPLLERLRWVRAHE